jgi:hypothetical protein
MNWIKTLGLALSLGILLSFAPRAQAVPIKPDLQKILNRQQNLHFVPARAGWYGPEMRPAPQAALNPVLEAYGPAATARSVRAALMAAAIPDPKALLAIGVLIVLMRILRQTQEQRREALVLPIRSAPADEERQAA